MYYECNFSVLKISENIDWDYLYDYKVFLNFIVILGFIPLLVLCMLLSQLSTNNNQKYHSKRYLSSWNLILKSFHPWYYAHSMFETWFNALIKTTTDMYNGSILLHTLQTENGLDVMKYTFEICILCVV